MGGQSKKINYLNKCKSAEKGDEIAVEPLCRIYHIRRSMFSLNARNFR